MDGQGGQADEEDIGEDDVFRRLSGHLLHPFVFAVVCSFSERNFQTVDETS